MNPNFLKQCAAILCAALTLTTASLFAETFTEGKQVPPTTQKLGVGDFVWEPERSPGGPVLIVVSVPEQVAYVYRNGIRIARTSVSTGRPGHPTPTGVFDILEKEKDHVSTIYKGAEMPWMERLTWTGIAMHAGDLPGYPDSHGCVRLPLEFSKLLYTVTTKGGTVIIADQHSAPRETVHPGMLFSQTTPPATDAGLAPGQFTWAPEKSGSGPVTILVSEPDKVVYVYRNGVEIGRSVIRSVGIKGLHIFSALDGRDEQGRSNGFVSMANQRRTIQTLPTWRRNPASTNNLLLECARSSFPAQPSSSPINRWVLRRKARRVSKSSAPAR